MAQNDYLIPRFAPVYVNTGDSAPLRYKSSVGIAVKLISASPASFFGYNIYNPNAVDCFLKFYDNSGPVVGSNAVTLTFQVPSLGSIVLIGTDMIYRFEEAFTMAATTGYSDGDTGAPAIDLLAYIFYK